MRELGGRGESVSPSFVSPALSTIFDFGGRKKLGDIYAGKEEATSVCAARSLPQR